MFYGLFDALHRVGLVSDWNWCLVWSLRVIVAGLLIGRLLWYVRIGYAEAVREAEKQ